MSIEVRIDQLELDVFKLKKMIHKKNEDQHRVWNDTQEHLLDAMESQRVILQQLEVKVEKNTEDITKMQGSITRIESDISEIKQLLQKITAK